jgi:uncharacterized protein (TIGR03435 family)
MEFASLLADRLEHPVIEKTGIQTRFAVNLEYRISEADTTRRASLASSRKKTGVNLKTAKGPVEILVMDHIEKMPSEN